MTLADALSLALLALALFVLLTGGFRVQLSGVPVSAKSPFRLFLFAAAVIAVRHVAFRPDSLPARTSRAVVAVVRGGRVRLVTVCERAVDFARLNGLELLGVFALLVALTVAMLYPQVRHLESVADYGDPLFSIWRLAWVAHQFTHDPIHLYDANIFWPERHTFAYSDGMPLTGAAAAPLIWLGVPPAIVYNLFVLASFVLAGVAMYGFVRWLVGSRLPALVSAVAFAFYPFRFEHYIHMELLAAFWMPLALWALHRTLASRSGRWRAGLLTGVLLAAQYLTGMYFGVFLACYLVVVGGTLVVAAGSVTTTAKPLVAGALLASVFVAPFAPPYLQVRRALDERTTADVEMFSAQPVDYVTARQPNARIGGVNERQVFPGVLLVVLALVALWPPFSATRVAYVLGLLFAFEVSLGSHGFLQPFLYQWFIPFRGVRAPARAAMLVGLSLSVLAGYGAARLSAVSRQRTFRVILGAVFCGIILFETHPTLAMRPVPSVHPVYEWFRGRPTATIVELPEWYPIGDRYLIYSTRHWQRMVNGFSGTLPASYRALHRAMGTFPGEDAIALLRSRGVSYAVVHEEFYGAAEYHKLIARMDASPSLYLISTATDGQFEARIYQVIR